MNLTSQTVTDLKAIKAEVVTAKGEIGWQSKLRKTLTGLLFAGLGSVLVWRGIDLLQADKDIGKWLVVGGSVLGLLAAHTWSSELVNGSLKVLPALLADGIRIVVGALRGSPQTPPGGTS